MHQCQRKLQTADLEEHAAAASPGWEFEEVPRVRFLAQHMRQTPGSPTKASTVRRYSAGDILAPEKVGPLRPRK